MSSSSLPLAIAALAMLASCSETSDYELSQPGGGVTLVQRTTMGGGAGGYGWTDLYLRFDGDKKLYPIGLHDHGGMNARWAGKGSLELCFAEQPEWVVLGVFQKGDVRVRIGECRYEAG